MDATRNVSPIMRRRLEAQGFVGLDDSALADVGPWLRLAPALCAAWAAAGTALGSPVGLWALVPLAALGALRQGHPFDALYNHGVRYLLGTRRLPPYGVPRRLACAVAAAWLSLTGAAFFVGASGVGYALGSVLVLMALLTALTNFCIPSWVYGRLLGKPAACPWS